MKPSMNKKSQASTKMSAELVIIGAMALGVWLEQYMLVAAFGFVAFIYLIMQIFVSAVNEPVPIYNSVVKYYTAEGHCCHRRFSMKTRQQLEAEMLSTQDHPVSIGWAYYEVHQVDEGDE